MLPADVLSQLDGRGFARLPALLSSEQCQEIKAHWNDRELFRSKIVMARHRYGMGTYRYFANPLPEKYENGIEHDEYVQLERPRLDLTEAELPPPPEHQGQE